MLTNIQVNDLVQSFGHKSLPSGTKFIALDKDINKEIVVAGKDIYYLKSTDNGELLEFRSMQWQPKVSG